MTHLAPSHSPQGTVTLAVVQAYLDDWLKFRRRGRRNVPQYVEDEFREYSVCGDPGAGFTTFGCAEEHFSRSFAYCCRGRGFCYFCLTYRQRQRGQHLMNSVIGKVPVRHWVECFPPQLRYVLVYGKSLFQSGFAAFAEAVFEYQQRKAEELWGVPATASHPAGVIVHHPASATLEANHHLHGIFLEGVYVQVEPAGRMEFRQLPAPTDDEVEAVAFQACLKLCEALEDLGFWKTTSISTSTIEGILTLPRSRASRAKFFGQVARDGEGGTAPRDGAYAFHVYRGNVIEAKERDQLKQLVDYILAPPFRDGQVSLNAEGNVVVELKRPRQDGTTHVVYTAYEFLDRLADLVPRPKRKTIRSFGAYAPRATARKQAVPGPIIRVPRPRAEHDDEDRCSNFAGTDDLLVCPICMRVLRVIATVRPPGRRRDNRWMPPDTPQPGSTRDQDRFGHAPEAEGQGRLFA